MSKGKGSATPAAGAVAEETVLTSAMQKEAKKIVSQIAGLFAERANLNADVKEICAAAKDRGFNPKALRACAVIQNEATDERAKRQAFDDLLDQYKHACGFDSTPLGSSGRRGDD